MTLDIHSVLILVLALAGMFAAWRASIYVGRLVVFLARVLVAVGGGCLAVYLFCLAWPYLVEMQQNGEIHFPQAVSNWEVVVR